MVENEKTITDQRPTVGKIKEETYFNLTICFLQRGPLEGWEEASFG